MLNSQNSQPTIEVLPKRTKFNDIRYFLKNLSSTQMKKGRNSICVAELSGWVRAVFLYDTEPPARRH